MANISRFDSDLSIPWCQAMVSDPKWKRIDTFSLSLKPGSTANSLIAETLGTERGIRAMHTLVKQGPAGKEPADGPEVRFLISLGDGVNGLDGVCHGGILGLLLDEITGEIALRTFATTDIVTAQLNIAYKRPLETPAVVLCRSWIVEAPATAQSRKVKIAGTVEDGHGGVYASADAIFVKARAKKL